MALALNRTPADFGPYFELAKTIAENSQLDFLEFIEADGTIVSSAQWPEQFGYPESSFPRLAAENNSAFFLEQEGLQSGRSWDYLPCALRAQENIFSTWLEGAGWIRVFFLSWICRPECEFCFTRIAVTSFHQHSSSIRAVRLQE